MTFNCIISAESYDQKLLQESISTILQRTILCSMATTSGSQPYINTAYFAYTHELDIYFLSQPTRQHSLNLANNPTIALTIFDSTQSFASHLQGLQVFGQSILTADTEAHNAFDIYSKRFPKFLGLVPTFEDYERKVIQSRFYKVTTKSIKIFDESRFGKDVYVMANITVKTPLGSMK